MAPVSPAQARHHPLRACALAALLGAASVFSFSPFDLFPLAWLTLGGLYLLLQQAQSVRSSACLGFAFGLGYFLTGTSWVFVSLSVFGGLPAPLAALATFLFCAFMGLYPALAATLASTLSATLTARTRPASFWWLNALLFAACWTLTEWLRGWFLTGFPWLSLGYSQTPPSPLAGYAPLFGVYSLSLLAAFLGVCLVESLRRGYASGWRRGKLSVLAPGLVAAVVLLIGQALSGIAWTTPREAPISVALLQGNVPQDLKWRPEKLRESLTIYHQLMQTNPASLTVLPETALPTFFDKLPQVYVDTLQDHARQQQGDVLFGIVSGMVNTTSAANTIQASSTQPYANAAVSLGRSATQQYLKSHLVPFGEFVPPGFQWFLNLMQVPMSDFTPGPAYQAPLLIAGERVAVNICYEDVFGQEIIRALPEATLLVNLSNTAWFGDSLAQPQHLQIAQLRAMETGRPMLRATNTGMTAVVQPNGAVSAVLPPFKRAALVAEVHGYTGATPYVRWGNAPIIGFALGVLLLCCAWRCFGTQAATARKTK